jgi:hypothetical protein
MPRYALKVEYHGAPFAGWQRQADQPSVQGAIEAALAKLEPGPHTIAAAGRTDAGVHALGRWRIATCQAVGPVPAVGGAQLPPETRSGGHRGLLRTWPRIGTRGFRRWSGAISFGC